MQPRQADVNMGVSHAACCSGKTGQPMHTGTYVGGFKLTTSSCPNVDYVETHATQQKHHDKDEGNDDYIFPAN